MLTIERSVGKASMESSRELFVEVARSHGIDHVDFSEPASHFLTANGIRLHYLDWGGSGDPILLLHGGGQTAHTWDFVCLQLRQRFHCYALDIRGHGKSDRMAPDIFRDPFDLGEDIRATVQALGLHGVAVVGMSFGGLTAMVYAIAQPPELKKLVIVDITPTMHYEGRAEDFDFMHAAEFDSFDQAVDQSARNNPYRPRIHHQFSLSHLLVQRADGKWAWKVGRSTINPALRTIEGREKTARRIAMLWPEVPRIACPTLVIHGEMSAATLREDAERLARTVRHGRVITIPRATHVIQGDQPRALAAEIARFLAGPG